MSNMDLPTIPDKLYFTIGEVGKLCDLRPHVLRYWEQEFPQLSPSKRRGNRRYYQRKDVLLIRQIKDLLYNQGFTIEGARQQLSGEGANKANIEKQKTQSSITGAITGLEKVARDLEDTA
ncbi:MAG: MerR family transcriptional regulator [Gammaproteobacteria bacterium]|nr:MerR family transcriptional regulator [Gammaproteobacteria bacterium]MCH9744135.1 MerR family transcriptional regulator [Gammaproteobacteria bacterium]